MPESATSHPNSTVNFSKHLDLGVPKQRRTLSSIQTDATSRNSSVQGIWEEDYYQRDLEFDGDSELSPLPAAHTSPVKSYEEEENITRRPSAVQQRGLTSLLPSILSPISKSAERRDKSRSSSPTKARGKEANTKEEDFMPTLTGDKEGFIKIEDRTRGLASWFSGSSAPVALGIPINMAFEEQPFVPRDLDAMSSPSPSPGKLRKMQASTDSTASTSTISTPKAATSSWRAPWSKSPVKQEQLPANLADDELFTLDISSALFPTSQNNAFSPSDYKNLQQTSLALLAKFQSAYQDRTRQYIDAQSTLEVEREETDEAETRVRSLRSQLEDLASQVSSRDTTISELVTQLAEEKRARAEEKEARERSIQLVRDRASQSSKHSSTSSLGLNIEDLGIRNGGKGHSKYGNHHNSMDLSSPADSETDSLSVTSSIFSRSRSPTLTISSTNASTDSTPEIAQAAFARVVPNPAHTSITSTPRPQRLKPQQQKSTFARLLTLSSSSSNETEIVEAGEEAGCANCRGQDSSVAWDTVGLLRAENRGLKERVGELEASVEGALDLCSGLGLAGR
ncbi:hypothetical protein NA56DRAFT_700822 [Hyaloscypha hepaticicola]|uniref:Uncharacterized protein n=1 Tax=Hyaloscypha hepaticicola TaxID=2082293 RepID=A0A2J6QDI6_9HELO|nr:hypothetical protein NA56DRAFT_700822 [Hyaloscypha hepaticicola]